MQAQRRAVYTGPSIRRHAAGIAVAVREHARNTMFARSYADPRVAVDCPPQPWQERHEGREDQIIDRAKLQGRC